MSTRMPQPTPRWGDYVLRASDATQELELVHDVPGCLAILCDAEHRDTAKVLAEEITAHDAQCSHRNEPPGAWTIIDYAEATASILGTPWYASGSFLNAHGYVCSPNVQFKLYVDGDDNLALKDDDGGDKILLDIGTLAETSSELAKQAAAIADTIRRQLAPVTALAPSFDPVLDTEPPCRYPYQYAISDFVRETVRILGDGWYHREPYIWGPEVSMLKLTVDRDYNLAIYRDDAKPQLIVVVRASASAQLKLRDIAGLIADAIRTIQHL